MERGKNWSHTDSVSVDVNQSTPSALPSGCTSHTTKSARHYFSGPRSGVPRMSGRTPVDSSEGNLDFTLGLKDSSRCSTRYGPGTTGVSPKN